MQQNSYTESIFSEDDWSDHPYPSCSGGEIITKEISESKERGKLRGKWGNYDENKQQNGSVGKEKCKKWKKNPIIFRYLAEKQ